MPKKSKEVAEWEGDDEPQTGKDWNYSAHDQESERLANVTY